MATKKIKTIDDLRLERARLKLEIANTEEVLREDLKWAKEELRPSKVAAGFIKNFLGIGNDGLLKSGANIAIDVLLKNVLLSKAGWLTKLIVPLFAKSVSSNILSEKKPEVFSVLRNLIKKARKYIRSSESNFYDKSTVDEMDY